MSRSSSPLALGVDFGTDSARAVVVDTLTGQAAASAVAPFPRWSRGLYQHPESAVFRQHPADYLDALTACVREAVSRLTEEQVLQIRGIAVDATGSTTAPVDETGLPLALLPRFRENEAAMFSLWKDHSAAKEADELNELFRSGSEIDYMLYQGVYSSEWFWAKVLHALREDEEVRQAAYAWVEHCDWITGLLCGSTRPETMFRSACAAGHKALWHSDWGGLPGDDVLRLADPFLCLVKERYAKTPRPAGTRAGTLTPEWAEALGLPPGIVVAGCSCDAHAGAVGAGIRRNTAVCTLGTSAVAMLVERPEALKGKAREISVFSGLAEDSILPGYIGIESGQASFGDVFAWFRRLLLWPLGLSPEHRELSHQLEKTLFARLEEQAAALPDAPFPVALDWFNGRRYPSTDTTVTAAVSDLTLGTSAPELYRGLVFGAAAGLKRNLEGLAHAGLAIDRVIAVGGITGKSPYVMQMAADVLEREIAVPDDRQTCAVGSAVYAAVAAGLFPDMESACAVMSSKPGQVFRPDPAKAPLYRAQYEKYLRLAEWKDRQPRR